MLPSVPDSVALTEEIMASAAAPDQVEEEVLVRLEARRIRELVRTRLDPAERRVVIQHFGLAGARKRNLREISAGMGCCAATALNIERRALKKLRSAYDEKHAA